jgi:hypothetical protein
MRLKEYIAHLSHVVSHFKTQGDIMEAIAEGKGAVPGFHKLTYDYAIEKVRDSLIRNKKLLGVYDQPIETEADREKAKEREIKPYDLKRHIIKSRHDLRHLKPKRIIDTSIGNDNALIEGYTLQIESIEDIVVQILAQLSEALGVNAGEVGGVFTVNEQETYHAYFERDQLPKPANFRSTIFPSQTNGTTTSTIYPPASSNPAVQQLLSNPPVPSAPILPNFARPVAPPPTPRKKSARNKKPQTPDKLAEQTEKALAARRASAAEQLAAMSEAEREAHLKVSQNAAKVKDDVAEKIKALEEELRARNIIQ